MLSPKNNKGDLEEMQNVFCNRIEGKRLVFLIHLFLMTAGKELITTSTPEKRKQWFTNEYAEKN